MFATHFQIATKPFKCPPSVNRLGSVYLKLMPLNSSSILWNYRPVHPYLYSACPNVKLQIHTILLLQCTDVFIMQNVMKKNETKPRKKLNSYFQKNNKLNHILFLSNKTRYFHMCVCLVLTFGFGKVKSSSVLFYIKYIRCLFQYAWQYASKSFLEKTDL